MKDLDQLLESEDAAFLFGDCRDFLLGHLRNQQKPWPQMTEQEQADLIAAVDLQAKHIVRTAVRVVNDYQFPKTTVQLGEVKIGGAKGIEAKITCANIEHNRTVLGENVDQMIMVVMCDSDAFMGAKEEPKPEADQRALPLDEDAEAA